MQLHSRITRRNLLGGALSVGLALTLSRGAQASPPAFAANSHWGGNWTSTQGAGSGKLKLTVSANPALGSLTLFGTLGGAQLSGNPSNATITTSIAGGTLQLKGSVDFVHNTPQLGFVGTYKLFSATGLIVDQGTVSLLKNELVNLITDNPTDANRASIDFFPPDFIGEFLNKNGLRGSLALQHIVPEAHTGEGPAYSDINGRLRLNDMTFGYTLTFAPRQNPDGSFGFVLLGTNESGNSAAVYITLSGAYYPATGRVLVGTLGGTYQLLSLRRTLDSGRFTLLQVP